MKATLFLLLSLAATVSLGAVPNPEAGPDPGVGAEGDLAAEEKGPGFLGVRAQAVPEALADQLKLEHGVALLSVEPGTPAAEAGLEKNDIITEVGDKKVGSMLELRDAIRAHKEGEEVTLKLVQQGKRVEKKVTLAAAPVIPQFALPQGGIQIGPGAGLQGGAFQWNLGGAGRFQMGDVDGSVEMKGDGDAKEVTVRDFDGEIVYEGPWVTPQDKAAPPAPVRRRIERVANMWGGGGLPFQRRFVLPPELDLEVPVPDFELPKDFGKGLFGVPEDAPDDGDAEEDAPKDDAPERGAGEE